METVAKIEKGDKRMLKKLLEPPKDWEKEWEGMPEFIQKDLTSFSSLIVHFRNKKDRENFAQLIKQKITHKTKSIWYPEVEIYNAKLYRYVDDKKITRRRK